MIKIICQNCNTRLIKFFKEIHKNLKERDLE
ncbi:hypothetical protein ES703_64901 [subsurface metagenome]